MTNLVSAMVTVAAATNCPLLQLGAGTREMN
jgi:hypothetical protein